MDNCCFISQIQNKAKSSIEQNILVTSSLESTNRIFLNILKLNTLIS